MKIKPLAKTALLIAGMITFGGNIMAQNIKTNGDLLGAFAENVFNKKGLNNLEQYMKKDYIQHNPLVAQGVDGFKVFFQDWFEKVPNFKYELKNIIISDDYVWVYGNYSGTPEGDWLGISAVGKSYDFSAVDIFRIEDGKLAEHWDVMDVYTLFKQLGTID